MYLESSWSLPMIPRTLTSILLFDDSEEDISLLMFVIAVEMHFLLFTLITVLYRHLVTPWE